ncbi:RNA-directed DNA polymerase from mobile element jockey [Willisornis vidua]|uniref:RNA-directed DNA polymerase from mobile element jockey n=1 Tax=Willisornis vidua TaxID=1566151 RepID=A0ABQ9CQY9_9PASS|nr:RNA-directed DNA polymerase from mobile element jockey [Willisornis vidua]
MKKRVRNSIPIARPRQVSVQVPRTLGWKTDREQNEAPIMQEEMARELPCKLDLDRSMGLDRTHPRVLRKLVEESIKPLSIIYQQSGSAEKVHADWKLAYVTPINKKGQKVS